jgi:hypothetical protein
MALSFSAETPGLVEKSHDQQGPAEGYIRVAEGILHKTTEERT